MGRQTKHEGIEQDTIDRELARSWRRGADEAAQVQAPSRQADADADAVMREYLHAVGEFVGKQVGSVWMGGAKDLHDPG